MIGIVWSYSLSLIITALGVAVIKQAESVLALVLTVAAMLAMAIMMSFLAQPVGYSWSLLVGVAVTAAFA
ncbi:MAG TPA: hypothetical protein PKD68_03395, partial [Candidatus Saccharibacteria bacterium]|nr:hypothetical protein [Candidatus Saccharibacteria bacterium]